MLKTFYYLQNFLGKAGLWPGDVEVVFRFKDTAAQWKFEAELRNELTYVQMQTTFTNPLERLTGGHLYGIPFCYNTPEEAPIVPTPWWNLDHP